MTEKLDIDVEQPSTVFKHFEKLRDDTAIINFDPKLTTLTKDNLPAWYNEELFKAGQKYYRRNMLSLSTGSVAGLLAVLVIPSILKVLVWTKKSSTACTAFTRYIKTLLHIYYIYTCDIDDPDSKFWKSLNIIRAVHAVNSRKSHWAGTGGITQRDMALTQFGLMGYALVAPEKLGLTNEKQEREGLNHFWRVIGHAIGIPDGINICRKSETETTDLCQKLLDEVFVKHMKNPPKKFITMSSAMLDGLWCIDPTLNFDAFMSYWYNLSGITYDKPLGLHSTLSFMYLNTIIYLLKIPYVRHLVRVGFNYYFTINYWSLEHVSLLGWIYFGRQNSKIIMYPSKARE